MPLRKEKEKKKKKKKRGELISGYTRGGITGEKEKSKIRVLIEKLEDNGRDGVLRR